MCIITYPYLFLFNQSLKNGSQFVLFGSYDKRILHKCTWSSLGQQRSKPSAVTALTQCWHWLSLITAWIRNHVASKVWDEITHSLGMNKQFHSIISNACNYLPMMRLKFIHVIKMGPFVYQWLRIWVWYQTTRYSKRPTRSREISRLKWNLSVVWALCIGNPQANGRALMFSLMLTWTCSPRLSSYRWSYDTIVTISNV